MYFDEWGELSLGLSFFVVGVDLRPFFPVELIRRTLRNLPSFVTHKSPCGKVIRPRNACYDKTSTTGEDCQ
jgi:hypothetical protein